VVLFYRVVFVTKMKYVFNLVRWSLNAGCFFFRFDLIDN